MSGTFLHLLVIRWIVLDLAVECWALFPGPRPCKQRMGLCNGFESMVSWYSNPKSLRRCASILVDASQRGSDVVLASEHLMDNPKVRR